jgi:uncharacterized protein (TIGR00251 family)
VRSQPYNLSEEHIRFAVRLTPRGGRDAIEGWSRDAAGKPQMNVRVSAPPEDGKANATLIALLAKRLGVAKSTVRIVSGKTARIKLIEVEGDTAAVSAELDTLKDPI